MSLTHPCLLPLALLLLVLWVLLVLLLLLSPRLAAVSAPLLPPGLPVPLHLQVLILRASAGLD